MAPTLTRSRPSKPVPSIRAGHTKDPSTLPKSTIAYAASADNLSTTNKRDKRHMKHSILISRLQASHPSTTRIQKKRQKAKESKQRKERLSVKLQDLGDALPDAGSGLKSASSSGIVESGLLAQSLKHKAGHAKRLWRLNEMERARFAKNIAVMSSEGDVGEAVKDGGGDAHAARWAALRQHILSRQHQQQP